MRFTLLAALSILLQGLPLEAQPSPHDASPPQSDQRILGIIPNFQTVSDPDAKVSPLTVKQKWILFARETFDPFSLGSAAFSSAFSQSADEVPNYGRGGAAFAKRFGAAVGDYGSQNLFSAAILASALHQDPRYFRKGPRAGVLARVVYSVSRVVITRQDSGQPAFNYSGILGMAMGIGASNLYYPSNSRNAGVMVSRLGTSLMGGVAGNLLSEFWPDIHQRLFHRKHHS